MSGGTAQKSEIGGQRSERASRWLPYAQLLRIPNVFTAMADIAMAALITGSLFGQFIPFALLLLASSCLYCGGMVWNDYFDYDQDMRERPFRPLPSQRIARPKAARLATALMAAGVGFAIFAGWREDGYYPGPLLIAVLLVGAILLYDAWLKRTQFGPIGMGLCRFLNVLLGLTVAVDGIPSWGVVPALVVGIYIVGVTWFARREARTSQQLELAAAAVVMLASLPLALFLPVLGRQLTRGSGVGGVIPFAFGELGHILFPYLLVVFGFWIGIPLATAVRRPTPQHVQSAVKRAILGLVVFDAVLATSLAGTAGLAVLLLLPAALYLGKWVYST